MTVYADDIAPVRFQQHVKRRRKHSKVAGALIQSSQMRENVSRGLRGADSDDLFGSGLTSVHIRAMELLSQFYSTNRDTNQSDFVSHDPTLSTPHLLANLQEISASLLVPWQKIETVSAFLLLHLDFLLKDRAG